MTHLAKLKGGGAVLVLVVLGSAGFAMAASPPAAPAAGSTLAQRTEQRKKEQASTLNDKDQKQIIAVCAGIQGKLRLIQNQETTNLDKHATAYRTIDARLWITIGRLKLASQDTSQLEKQRLGLIEKSTNFETIATHYKQALDDTLVVNCQADPTGFKALLDTTRAYYGQLRTVSADVKDYVMNTIKPALQAQVSGLQTKSGPSGGGN